MYARNRYESSFMNYETQNSKRVFEILKILLYNIAGEIKIRRLSYNLKQRDLHPGDTPRLRYRVAIYQGKSIIPTARNLWQEHPRKSGGKEDTKNRHGADRKEEWRGKG